MSQNLQTIILAFSVVVLAVGLGFSGTRIHDGLTHFRSYDRSVTMKGLAQEDVIADLAIWPLSYTERGNDLSVLQNLMEEKGKRVVSFLKQYGLEDDEIELKEVKVQDLMAQSYRQNNAVINRYILTQTYLVRTNKIDKISKAAQNMGGLIKQGIVFSQNGSTSPTYLYTKLNDIKPQMIAKATENARQAAKEFAQNSGSKVGNIKYASQGVFQILPRDETYAVPESEQKNKTIRVVATIQFYLED